MFSYGVPPGLPVLDLDNKAIKIKDGVKYLGNSFNSKGNNSNLIEKRIQDARVIIPDILAITNYQRNYKRQLRN